MKTMSLIANNILKKISQKWENIVLFFIILSLVHILLESLDVNNDLFVISLLIFDALITSVFIIDYIVQIVNFKKQKNAKSLLIFLLSPRMVIDLFSILPFLIIIVYPELYAINILRLLRLFRLFKLFSKLKSSDFLINAMKNKKSELLISSQAFLLITIILSSLLYYVENSAQPENFSNIFAAFFWSLSKFIEGIGGYGEFTPLTYIGKFLATIVGVLGIAIFAIPAGIIASGFVEEIETQKYNNKLEDDNKLLCITMMNETRAPANRARKKIGITSTRRRSLEVEVAKYRLFLTEENILNIARNGKNIRLKHYRYKARDYNVIEYYDQNTIYGTYYNKNSKITIISMSSHIEILLGAYTYFLSEYLNSNYISNEKYYEAETNNKFKLNLQNNEHWINFNDNCDNEVLNTFSNDLAESTQNNNLVVFIKAGSSKFPSYHILNGGKLGTEGFIENGTFNNLDALQEFYSLLKTKVSEINQTVATHEYYGIDEKDNIIWFVKNKLNINSIALHVNTDIFKGSHDDFFNSIKILGDALNHLSKSIEK